MNQRAALEELARRELRRRQTAKVVAALRLELFNWQTRVWDCENEHIAVLCPRRAGKTSLWARLMVGEAITNDRVLIRAWHASRLRAKQLLYEEIKLVCQRHNIEVKDNETELTFKFKNGSELRLVGADKDKEVQKKRGDKVWVDIVLESQNFGSLLKPIVEDVIDPCLIDERQRGGGKLYLEGSPGPTCGGLWFDITGRYEELEGEWASVGGASGEGLGYTCFRWQTASNPFMPHAKAEFEKLRIARRWTEANPTYRREYMGLWVNDYDALFYKYDEARNGYTLDEVTPWGDGWHHILGWDLGSRDDMALVVWGYHDNRPDLYEAFSWKKPGALSHEVMEKIDELEKRGFNFEGAVADTQGGGKMYVEDVMARYSRHFEPAQKSEKFNHVTMFNDDLLTAHVKVLKGSDLETELKELPRDPDWEPESGKPPTEAKNFPNHCCDAGLYSWRKARHYWHVPAKKVIMAGSPEAVDEMEQQVVAALEKRRSDDEEHWLEREFGDYGGSDEW